MKAISSLDVRSPWVHMCVGLSYTANMIMGNHYTTKCCVCVLKFFTLVYAYKLCITNFCNCNWKYHLFAAFGAEIKCPKDTGSKVQFLAVNIFTV